MWNEGFIELTRTYVTKNLACIARAISITVLRIYSSHVTPFLEERHLWTTGASNLVQPFHQA